MMNLFKLKEQSLLDVKNFAPYAEGNAINNINLGIYIIPVNLTKFKDLEEIWISKQIKYVSLVVQI